jgi:hypothetical protein
MPDVLEPPTQPKPKRGFFTAENAVQYALKSHAARKLASATPEPVASQQQAASPVAADTDAARSLVRVQKQLEALDVALDKCKEAKEWDMLTRAKERLFKAWVHLAGIPGPGNRKPAPERSQRDRSPGAWIEQQPAPVQAMPQPQTPAKPMGWEYDDLGAATPQLGSTGQSPLPETLPGNVTP